MGGAAKGLLTAPRSTETLVERLQRVSTEALGDHPIVLIGAAPAYAGLGIELLADSPPGVGPLGGLCALLDAGAHRGSSVIALACDMPFVTAELIARLFA